MKTEFIWILGYFPWPTGLKKLKETCWLILLPVVFLIPKKEEEKRKWH